MQGWRGERAACAEASGSARTGSRHSPGYLTPHKTACHFGRLACVSVAVMPRLLSVRKACSMSLSSMVATFSSTK